jgi:hypothetical protein
MGLARFGESTSTMAVLLVLLCTERGEPSSDKLFIHQNGPEPWNSKVFTRDAISASDERFREEAQRVQLQSIGE